MNLRKMKIHLPFFLLCYLIGFLAVFGLKLFYSRAGSDALTWILTPTARWVSILSGISFTYESGSGYVNHSLRYVIAPSCCGVQFMCIAAAVLIFTFVHRTGTHLKAFLWTVGSLGFSYLYTIFVNGLRIILAMYLPSALSGSALYRRFLTPESLHTLIGTVVYFTALLVLYRLAGLICDCLYDTPHPACRSFLRQSLSPVFWYFSIVLGVPFLNRAYTHNREGFTEYAVLVTVSCFAVFFLIGAFSRLVTFPQKIKRPFFFRGILKSRYRKKELSE